MHFFAWDSPAPMPSLQEIEALEEKSQHSHSSLQEHVDSHVTESAVSCIAFRCFWSNDWREIDADGILFTVICVVLGSISLTVGLHQLRLNCSSDILELAEARQF
jgi:hypothetical protein